MDIGNALLTFSQLALGLAGFSAILVALSGRPHLWTPVDSFRIKNMLTFAFEAVFLSLVPFMLAFFAISESVLWRISLVVLAAATSGGTLLVLGRFSRYLEVNARCCAHHWYTETLPYFVLRLCLR